MGKYYEINCINRLIDIADKTQASWAKAHINRYIYALSKEDFISRIV